MAGSPTHHLVSYPPPPNPPNQQGILNQNLSKLLQFDGNVTIGSLSDSSNSACECCYALSETTVCSSDLDNTYSSVNDDVPKTIPVLTSNRCYSFVEKTEFSQSV